MEYVLYIQKYMDRNFFPAVKLVQKLIRKEMILFFFFFPPKHQRQSVWNLNSDVGGRRYM